MALSKPTFPRLNLSQHLAYGFGLSGAWAFYEGGGPFLHDLSNTRTATYGDLINFGGNFWQAGQFGWGLKFTNSNDSYVRTNATANPGTTDYSVFAWVTYSANGALPMIASARNSSGATNVGWQLFQNGSGGNISFTFCDGSASRVRVDSTGPSLNDGKWHQVGVVFTRSANGVLYVDGIPATGGSGSIAAQNGNVSNSLSLMFGNEEQQTGTFAWDGFIDAVTIHNKALSITEITRLYEDPFVLYRQPDSRWLKAAAVATAKFRRTLSGIGTRTGSRQVHGWN